jgi:hypothetical protein
MQSFLTYIAGCSLLAGFHALGLSSPARSYLVGSFGFLSLSLIRLVRIQQMVMKINSVIRFPKYVVSCALWSYVVVDTAADDLHDVSILCVCNVEDDHQ